MSDYFVHGSALCETQSIGKNTRIWAFAHILPGAHIGEDCNICDGVFIENDVVVGARVTVKCGVQLWDGVRLEDDVFVGPNVTFTNDLFPRSRVRPSSFVKTIIRKGASIGANATLLAGIEIGRNAMIGAGSVVTRSVPANAIVVGNPARISGYVNASKMQSSVTQQDREGGPASLGFRRLELGAASLFCLRTVRDMRGDLSVGEFQSGEMPFKPERFFIIHNVPSREVRGEHAHKRCEQFLVCVQGSCSALADDGITRKELRLDKPNYGLYMPAMIWGAQYNYSADAKLLVFASLPYDPDDYIRDYDEFRSMVVHREGNR